MCIVVALAFVPLLTSFRKRVNDNEILLGRRLFSERMLSRDGTISCASCHIPAFAFADTARISVGVFGRRGNRNSPSSMNVLLRRSLFWDGRANTLEEQALAPIENPVEMDLPVDSAIARLAADSLYKALFLQTYKEAPNAKNLGSAIAAFERTLETSDSPFDNWKFTGDSNAVSASVKRGFELFNTKGKCIQCHFGADLTANEFRNIGLFNGLDLNDSGRALISKGMQDLGKFKTPSLRNVAVTAPYMHNGMFRTLDEVIDFYNDTKSVVSNSINKDTILDKPLNLTKIEREDIKAFLLALTDKQFLTVARNEKAGATK